MRLQLRCLCYDDSVHVADGKPCRADKPSRLGQEFPAVCARIVWVGIGKMLPDVAKRRRSEEGVGNGVQQHIRIRVPQQPLFIRYIHAAEDELASLHQSMHVVADTHSRHTLSSLRRRTTPPSRRFAS